MEVGDTFTVVGTQGKVFSNGSTVKLERIEADGHHLLQLLIGECKFEDSSYGQGAFLHFEFLQPIEGR